MIKDVVALGKALSDPSRIRALLAIHRAEDLCVCQIKEILGLANATVSAHMKILEDAGLVTRTKHGRWVHYSIRANRSIASSRLLRDLVSSCEEDPAVAGDRDRVGDLEPCGE